MSLSLKFHFILLRCCLPDGIYKKFEYESIPYESCSEGDLVKWYRHSFTHYGLVPRCYL